METISQWFKCIILRRFWQDVHNIQTPDHGLYTADWLSRQNHTENKDGEIAGLHINIDSLNITAEILTCIRTKDIQAAMHDDIHVQEVR